MKHLVVCWVLLLVSNLSAAPPATKPAAKPDPTTVAVSFDDLGFRLYVPKVWKQAAKNETSATYQLPGGGFVILAMRVGDKKDLKAAIEDKKTFLAKSAKGVKYLKDEATKLGGQAAWQLVYDVDTTARQVDPKTGKDVPNAQPVVLKQRAMAVMCVHNGVEVHVTFVAGDKDFEGRSKLGLKALSTFEWTGVKK